MLFLCILMTQHYRCHLNGELRLCVFLVSFQPNALRGSTYFRRSLMTKKVFALQTNQIKPLATGYGGCIATDMITVQGKKVGYMVREPTTRQHDSGWCFMAGDESQEYMDNADNHAIYDVNTIANYSPDIIELLDSPPRSAFVRDAKTGKLVEVPYEPPLE